MEPKHEPDPVGEFARRHRAKLLAILMLFLALAVVPPLAGRATFAEWGAWLGAVASTGALVGVAGTLSLQMKELALQRRELEETKEALRRTAQAQEGTEKALREQLSVLSQSVAVQARSAEALFATATAQKGTERALSEQVARQELLAPVHAKAALAQAFAANFSWAIAGNDSNNFPKKMSGDRIIEWTNSCVEALNQLIELVADLEKRPSLRPPPAGLAGP